MKVSQVLGHVGTPAFRRQLSVGLAVSASCQAVFNLLGNRMGLDAKSLRGNIFSIISSCISVAAASLAASRVTHEAYRYINMGLIAVSLALAVNHFYQKRSQSN